MKDLSIFVGSSLEAKKIDTTIRDILEDNEDINVTAISWSDSFNTGEFGLESLLNISQEVDGALLIATTDDKTWYRGNEYLVPRDNILFEMGLFIKAFGRKKTAIVVVKNSNGEYPKLPTDLAGLNVIKYDVNKKAKNEKLISNWIDNFPKLENKTNILSEDIFNVIQENFSQIPHSWKDDVNDYVLAPFRKSTFSALRGEFLLTSGQYYQNLFIEMNNADKNSLVRAVSTISSKIWVEDIHQKRYTELNLEAKTRGVEIRRLFVLTQEQITNLWPVIEQQIANGIKIKIVEPRLYVEYGNLDDCAIFTNPNSNQIKSFISMQFYDNTQRIRGGKLILNNNYCLEQIDAFDKLWSIANKAVKPDIKHSKKVNVSAPGGTLQEHTLEYPVVSCKEAAKARGIPLENELKTLIVDTKNGFVAIHLPGDSILNLRSVKNALELNEAYLADPEDLEKLNLTAGTVSAVLDPVWSMPHLISKRILKLDYVATNNGTKTGYFKFDPIILLQAKNVIVDDFEKKGLK